MCLLVVKVLLPLLDKTSPSSHFEGFNDIFLFYWVHKINIKEYDEDPAACLTTHMGTEETGDELKSEGRGVLKGCFASRETSFIPMDRADFLS